MLTFVAAIDRNRAIGRGGALPWHLPDDLKRFKALTIGKPVLMGRKTAQSIGRALPGRLNLVLSRHLEIPFGDRVGSLEEAINRVGDAELMVIGGGEIYRLAYETAQKLIRRIHLTVVDTEILDADAFFPIHQNELDRLQWREVSRQHHEADAHHAYAFDFVDYEKIDS